MKTKYFNAYILLLAMLLTAACQRESSPTSNEVDNANKTRFEFKELVAEATSITIYQTPKIKAIAIGDDLTYTWSSDLGLIIGSGSEVMYSICHETESTVTCKVSDKYGNSDTKSIIIKSYEL